jgi:hypothetical protein
MKSTGAAMAILWQGLGRVWQQHNDVIFTFAGLQTIEQSHYLLMQILVVRIFPRATYSNIRQGATNMRNKVSTTVRFAKVTYICKYLLYRYPGPHIQSAKVIGCYPGYSPKCAERERLSTLREAKSLK